MFVFEANTPAKAPLGITKLPTVLLIDRKGMIRHRHEGYDETQLRGLSAKIEELLDESDEAPKKDDDK